METKKKIHNIYIYDVQCARSTRMRTIERERKEISTHRS